MVGDESLWVGCNNFRVIFCMYNLFPELERKWILPRRASHVRRCHSHREHHARAWWHHSRPHHVSSGAPGRFLLVRWLIIPTLRWLRSASWEIYEGVFGYHKRFFIFQVSSRIWCTLWITSHNNVQWSVNNYMFKDLAGWSFKSHTLKTPKSLK